jgi:hypothetical protein
MYTLAQPIVATVVQFHQLCFLLRYTPINVLPESDSSSGMSLFCSIISAHTLVPMSGLNVPA